MMVLAELRVQWVVRTSGLAALNLLELEALG
jgi:hypothetical protein